MLNRSVYFCAFAVCFWLFLILILHVFNGEYSLGAIQNYGRIDKEVDGKIEAPRPTTMPPPSDTSNYHFSFLHLSDIHINKDGCGHGTENLEYFLRTTMPLIDPLFVVATGDLTDAKIDMALQSKQHKEEWETYHGLLKAGGVTKKPDFWFDIRGNHDCFDVEGWSSPNNYFATHSITKKSEYDHVFDLSWGGKYGIVAVDGCPEHGPSRPFNFFSTLTPHKMDKLEESLQKMERGNVTHTFILSHYPIVTSLFSKSEKTGRNIKELSNMISVWLCGHLHRMVGGIGRYLYGKPNGAFLDLEVDDLKDHGMFRIVCVDHDFISFLDAPIDEDQYAIISNPKDSRFLLPGREPTSNIELSTHIRVHIWDKTGLVDKAQAEIDGTVFSLTHGKGSLWTAPWSPLRYRGRKGTDKNPLTIKVSLFDVDKNELRSISQPFSVEGQPSDLEGIGTKISEFPLSSFVRALFWSALIVSVLTLILVKMHSLSNDSADLAYLRSEISQSTTLLTVRYMPTALYFCVKDNDPYYLYTLANLMYLPLGPLAIYPITSTANASFSYFYLWGIWNSTFGWTRLFDTWNFSCISLCLQIIPSIPLIALHANHRGKDNLPILIKFIFACWWSIVCVKNISLLITFGPYFAFFGFGFFWHFVLMTVMIISWYFDFNKRAASSEKMHSLLAPKSPSSAKSE